MFYRKETFHKELPADVQTDKFKDDSRIAQSKARRSFSRQMLRV